MNRAPAPATVRVAGVILGAMGILILVAHVSTAEDVTPPYTAIDYLLTAIPIVLGVALVAGQRWAGFLGLLAALMGIALGFVAVGAGPDVAMPGSNVLIGLIFIVPSVAMLVALLTPRAWAWLRGTARSEAEPPIAPR